MALYNDIVMDNFLNPKNVGELENPDGTGVYGSPVCGDMMQIQKKVDENDKITDDKFKTVGGGSVEEALDLTNKQIIDELGGLPPVKVHCSVLADKAIKNAIYDYAQKTGKHYAALEGYDPEADEDDEHGEEE